MTTYYCKLNWVVTPTAASVPDVVSLFEQFIISPGTLYAAIDLANALFSIPVKIAQVVCIQLGRPEIYLLCSNAGVYQLSSHMS